MVVLNNDLLTKLNQTGELHAVGLPMNVLDSNQLLPPPHPLIIKF